MNIITGNFIMQLQKVSLKKFRFAGIRTLI